MVKVRSLLPVYLNIHKMMVHDGSCLRIFKTFPFHDMAPVAGGISDTYQHGLVFLSGFLDSFISPGIPVDRVVGVLEQVGTAFVNEFIGVGLDQFVLLGIL